MCAKTKTKDRPVLKSILQRLRHCIWLPALVVSGCAAVHGAPDPVIETEPAIAGLATYLDSSALTKFYAVSDDDRGGLSKRQWRDVVIDAHIQASNLRFRDFKQELSSQGTGFGIAADWAVLGLSAAGAVASGGITNALSAASAGLVGARASVNKEAYYDKTLPALIAAMEANRKAMLLQIRTAQKNNDESGYSLSAAIGDLILYEDAGSLQSAVGQITTSATNQSTATDKEIATLFQAVPVTAATQAKKMKPINYVFSLDLTKPEGRDTLRKIAEAIGAKQDEDPKAELKNVVVKLDQLSPDETSADALAEKLKDLMP